MKPILQQKKILKTILQQKKNIEIDTATKKDIAELKALITNRYLPINNMPYNQFGNVPFYDIETKAVVYLIANKNT